MKYRALLLLITVALISALFSLNLHSQTLPRTYVGSAACGDCHVPIYQRWAKTRMANVVTDPRARPQVVIPDFSKADPLLTFKLDDVALVYGTKWKQRYFKKVGDDYFPLFSTMGRESQDLASLLRSAEHGLVGSILSGG